MEESALFDIGDVLKIRAIDSEETFSVDDYMFAFFQTSKEPLEAIRQSIRGLDYGHDHAKQETGSISGSPGSRSRHVTDTTNSSPRSRNSSPVPSSGKQHRDSSSSLRPKLLRSDSDSSLKSAIIAPLKPIASLTEVPGRVRRQLFGSLDSGSGSPESESVDKKLEAGRMTPEGEMSDGDLISNYDILTATDSESWIEGSKRKKKPTPLAVVNKVTEMWGGGMKHFNAEIGDQSDKHLVSTEDRQESNERFRAHFSLGDSENLVATYYAHIQKTVPIYGKIYVSNSYLCFRSLLPGTKTKMILPLRDVENVAKEKGFRFGYSGLVIVIQGHEEVFFEFGLSSSRDDCEMMVLRELDRVKRNSAAQSTTKSSGEDDNDFSDDETLALKNDEASPYQHRLRQARLTTYEDAMRREGNLNFPTVVVDSISSYGLLNDIKPKDTLRFTMLTIGSRGDVQPYIALGKGLLKEGHKVRIATHSEFKDWIESYGIEFAPVAGDPAQLMKIMIDHGMFSVAFIREAASKFRSWIDDLLQTSWEACQDTDILIESPSAMGGIHIAEALKIPYFRAFTMPWTRTRAYPHAFIVPEQKMGGSYNYLTYVLFDNVFWKGISGQVNRFRTKVLDLPRTNLDKMQANKVPFLYNISPAVFPPPVDFGDWVKVTGYWFLDEGGKDFKPPQDLVDFIAKARKNNDKIVYIGFGSIVVDDPKVLTKAVVDSVLKAGVKCILSKGWSDRLGSKDAKTVEIELPPEIFQIKSAPHDWLFPQMDAAVHHGGSGTTGASLRAGLPTIIKPFFGDQFFYAGRIEDLGVGINLKKLTVSYFSKALWEITHNERLISKAAAIGKQIRSEDGVSTAIEIIYRELDYARSLIKTDERPSTHHEVTAADGSWMLIEEDA